MKVSAVSLDEEAVSQDGRKARSKKTRALIIDALMALIGEGNLQPTGDEVAQRADVGHRTVFRHFEDMDSLYREIDERIFVRVIRHVEPAMPGTSTDVRVEQIVNMRAKVFEEAKMFRRATTIRRWSSPFLQEAHKRYTRLLRDRMHEMLPELSAGPREIAAALEALLCFQAWEQLREDQRLSVTRAKEVQLSAARAILRDL